MKQQLIEKTIIPLEEGLKKIFKSAADNDRDLFELTKIMSKSIETLQEISIENMNDITEIHRELADIKEVIEVIVNTMAEDKKRKEINAAKFIKELRENN